MKTNRNPPSLDDISEALSLVPGVTDDDVMDALLAAAAKRDPPWEYSRNKFILGVQQAFAQYFHDRIWLALCQRSTASAVAKELKEIASKAEKLLASFGVNEKGARRRPAYLCIWREANRLAEEKGGYPDLPTRTFSRVRGPDGTVVVEATDYRGDEKVLQIINGVELLQELAETAYKYERRKVEKAKQALKEAGKSKNAQRGRNEPMVRLIGNLNGCWIDCFEEVPGGIRPSQGGEVGGPYIRFLKSLFDTLHDRSPPELERYVPSLRASLYKTPESLYSVIRQTGLTKLRRIAKSKSEKI